MKKIENSNVYDIIIYITIINLSNHLTKMEKTLFCNKNNGHYYYGSHEELKFLMPKAVHKINGDSAVLVTNEYWYALLKVAESKFESNWNKNTICIGYIDDFPCIIELAANALDILKGTSGYMHHIVSSQFQRDGRLSCVEFISSKMVKITNTRYVEDVYNALLFTKVNMVPYEVTEKYTLRNTKLKEVMKYLRNLWI